MKKYVIKNNLNKIEKDIFIENQEEENSDEGDEVTQDFILSEELKLISECSIKLQFRHNLLCKELSKCDQEIVDIEHAMEFKKCNASQGYNLYRLMHNIRNKRREIKNEIEQINNILNMQTKSVSIERINKMNTKQIQKNYNPRVLDWLF